MYEISTNLVKMYEYPMYCKMLGVGNSAILKKKNVCKSLVEPISAILARFSIFSIHQRLMYSGQYEYSITCTSTAYDCTSTHLRVLHCVALLRCVALRCVALRCVALRGDRSSRG